MSQDERSPALGARRPKLGLPSILLGLPLDVLADITLFHPACLWYAPQAPAGGGGGAGIFPIFKISP